MACRGLYCSTVRPHLEYAVEANSSNMKTARGLRHVPYEERLRQLNLFSLERRCLRAKHILALKIFKDEINPRPFDSCAVYAEVDW